MIALTNLFKITEVVDIHILKRDNFKDSIFITISLFNY